MFQTRRDNFSPSGVFQKFSKALAVVAGALFVNFDRRKEMAFVSKNNIKKIDKDRVIVIDVDGKRYFQIDTYVRRGRQNKDSISQSLQFDEESAKKIIELIAEAFEW